MLTTETTYKNLWSVTSLGQNAQLSERSAGRYPMLSLHAHGYRGSAVDRG